MGLQIDGKGIAGMMIDGKSVVEARFNGTVVYQLETYSVVVTLSESLTGSSWSTSSVTIGSGQSQTVYINADADYSFTGSESIGLTETAGGAFYSTSVGAYDSTNDRWAVTITASTLTDNQTGTLTHSSGSATANSYTFTISFDDKTGTGLSINEGNVVVTGTVGTSLNGSRNVTIQNGYVLATLGASDNSSVITTTDDNEDTVSWSGSMPSGGGSATITVTGTATPVYSGSFDGTLHSSVQSVSFSPSGYSNKAAGSSVSTTATLTAASGYQFSDGVTTKQVSLNGTVPNGGGTITFDLTDETATALVSGTIVYSVSSNVQAIASDSYTNEFPGSSISWSVTLVATNNHEFDTGDTKAVSGTATVPNGGGQITVDLTSYLPTEKNTLTNVNPTSISIGSGGGSRTITFSQTGDAVPTLSSLPSWITQTSTLTNSSTSVTINVQSNSGLSRNDGILLSKGNDSETITISQAAAQAPASSGTLSPDTIAFTLGTPNFTGVSLSVSVVDSGSGQWNLQGGGNNITLNGVAGGTGISGVGNATVTVRYNGNSNAKDGTFTLRSGTVIGSGTVLDTANLNF